MSNASAYQTVNFHFNVIFSKGSKDVDVRFQSVTGLDSSIETENIKEGGENRFEHVVPLRRKYGPLVLKRGLLKPVDSGLLKWFQDAFENENIEPLPSVTINLLDEEHQPLLTWMITNVWPRSWKIGELNAEQNAVLIETLELNYNILLTDPGGSGKAQRDGSDPTKPLTLKPRGVQRATEENTE